MDSNFGVNRVLEPKDVVPVAAWKLDNRPELGNKEARINLELIHFEWDNFQQICSSCGFDEERIKIKIYDLIEKRGKLHNPYTGTSGVLLGTVDELSDDIVSLEGIKPGDKIYCISSLCGIPLYIEDIINIDYNYGQIRCKGYAILFEATPIYKLDERMNPNYTLAAIDEAGNLYENYRLAVEHNNKRVAIIGRNVYTTVMYAAAIREAIGPTYNVIAIMDKYAKGSLTEEEIEEIMFPLIKKTYFVDLSQPLKSYKGVLNDQENSDFFDHIIVAEDIFGAETLAILLVKKQGDIYFTSLDNHYSTASLTAETMDKNINIYAFQQFSTGHPEFTMQIVKNLMPKLEDINTLYDSKKTSKKLTKNQKKSYKTINAGKIDEFVFQSMVTRSMVEDVLNIAKYDCNVIIQGETGVGKEKVLALIHQNSERCGNPCIKINCATIQENLAESEFFGYEGGAFTGAQSSGKKGYFELANNGILFLDEIGALSLNMQSKLLRVIQENQFFRVGGVAQQSVNVRVICANNVPLKKLVDEGQFREDLYYRLNICKIDVPPLRDRREDVICLAEAFLNNLKKKYKVEREISPGAMNSLYKYYWPGNVRELENIIHRLVISSKNIVINQEDVDEMLNENAYEDMVISVKKSIQRVESLDFHQLMEQQEKQIIEYALKKEGTTRKAAELLGLPQTTFARKKIKYNL